MKLSRREATALFVSTPLWAQKPTPAPEQPNPAPKETQAQAKKDPVTEAYDDVRQNSQKLRDFQLPLDVEPAFIFKAL